MQASLETDKVSTILSEEPAAGVGRLSLERQAEKNPGEKKPIEKGQAAKPSKRGVHRWLLIVAIGIVAGGAWYGYARHAAVGRGEKNSESSAGETKQRVGRATLGFATDGNAAQAAKDAAAPRCETVPVEVLQRSDTLRLTGSLNADEQSSVASNTSGIAAEVFVDRGSIVKKGDVLVQIDPTDAKNKLAEGLALIDELKARLGIGDSLDGFDPADQPEVRIAKASADLATSNLKRATEMHTGHAISTEAYDRSRTECELALQHYRQSLFQIKQVFQSYKTATTKLAILEKAVADTTVRAPFDGWVAEKLVAVGEQISSGMQATEVVTLVRIDPLRLALTVSQQDIGCIQAGQAVRFRVDSFPGQVFTGTVQFIAPVVTNDTRSMVVEAVVPNPDGALRPGLFATAELELPQKGAEIFVPLGAVQRTGEVARVFVVRDGMAREQVVSLGDTMKGKIQVKSGLTAKDVLVADPDQVHDGDVVRK
jgi:RND family efflux transporter MFP subunit